MYKLVLTGGPCSGKTRSLEFLKNHLEANGYTVIIIPETATELIKKGLMKTLTASEFQKAVLSAQIKFEQKAYESSKKNKSKVVIICDRGLMDAKAYLTESEFKDICDELGINETSILNRYDLVICLKSTAGTEAYEMTEVREEDAKLAKILDKKTRKAWNKHHNIYEIDAKPTLDEKVDEIIKIVDEKLAK